MKSLSWTLLVLALVAMALFLFFSMSTEETKTFSPAMDGTKSQASTLADTPASPAEAPGSLPSAIQEDSSRVEIPSTKSATASKAVPASTQLKGIVTDSSGRPLAGVRLSLFESDFPDFPSAAEERVVGKEKQPAAKTQTGADGRFHFPDLHFSGASGEGDKQFARLDLSLQGFASQGPETVAVMPGTTRDAGTFVLFRAAKISGRIEAPGLALQGAAVRARGATPGDLRSAMNLISGEVAPDGSFEISGLAPGAWVVQASATGLLAASSEAVSLIEGDQKTGVVLRLKEGLSIHGVVTGPQGQPVVGAELFLTRVFKSLDEMGEHVGGGLDGVGGERNSTDAQGRYLISGLHPGEYALRVKAKGYAEASRSSVQAGGQAVDFKLGERGGIAGIVQDGKTGNPVAAGKVIAQRVQEGIMLGLSGRGIAEVRTDAAGAFRLEGLEPGRYRLEITKEGFAKKSIEEVLVQTAQETSLGSIALGHGGRLRVRVLEPQQEKGIAEASAKLSQIPEEGAPRAGERRRMVMVGGPARPKESAQERADDHGLAVFENLSAGRYLVEAGHPDWASAKEETLLGEGEERTITLQLTRGASLCGAVFTVEGAVYPNASVRLSSASGERFDTLSDSEGKYCLRHLAAGKYWAELREESAFEDQFVQIDNGSESRDGIEILLADGQETTLDLRATEKGNLSGIVRQGETPVEGVRIVISEGEESFGPMMFGPGAKMQSSNTEGAYRIEKIKPGKYTVSASRSGAALPVKANLEIRAGENQLDLSIPGGVIEGSVVDAATGKPVVGARVVAEERQDGKERRQMFAVSISMDDGGGGSVVTSDGGPGDPSKTDSEGKFRMHDMPAGKFRLRVKDAPGYADKDFDGVELGKDERKQGVEIRLERGGTVRGKLLDAAGNPVSFGILFLEKVGGSGPPKITGTGPDGAYRFDGVLTGEYKLRTGMRGEKGAEAELTVKAGETVEKELRIPKD